MSEFSGKTYVVTGAAGGIGFATCRRIVDAGGNVLLVDQDERKLEKSVATLASDHADMLTADVSSVEDNQRIAKRVIERFGKVHGAVLNVGVPGTIAAIIETDVDNFDRVMAVNVRGSWLGLKFLIPEIVRAGGGSIVLTGSTAGYRAGAPGRAPYVTSKHAVIGLTKAAAVECAPLGIRVNSVSPGGVRTQMTDSVKDFLGEEQGSAVLKRFAETIPLKRLAEADEIASAIVYLLSEDSRYCTATNLMVDGGLMG